MIDTLSKRLFGTLAGSRSLQTLASRYGMRSAHGLARRFVAGETVDAAIQAAKAVESQGLGQTLDLLGERVSTEADSLAATDAYLSMMPRMVAADIGRNISIKLTQLGLTLDRDLCISNLRAILAGARDEGFFVRIDMEESAHTEATLDIFQAVWSEGLTNVGVVLQSALRRSEDDLGRLLKLGARIRLVKGAYSEPASVAYQSKAEVEAAFLRMLPPLLAGGACPAVATHDPVLIAATRQIAADLHGSHSRFEFQMLYGVRRDLQHSLVSEGYGVRVYIPFGHDWFPYVMRRLGERPANVAFVLKNILRERRKGEVPNVSA